MLGEVFSKILPEKVVKLELMRKTFFRSISGAAFHRRGEVMRFESTLYSLALAARDVSAFLFY